MCCLLLWAAAPGCKRTASDAPKQPDSASTFPRPGRIRITVGDSALWVEVAETPETRELGLMFRRELPDDEGMLFVFEYPQQLSFWMKNTYLPLDIAFVSSEGVILNIRAMKPMDDGPRYLSAGSARYAIETNRGWFKTRGIGPGDRVRF